MKPLVSVLIPAYNAGRYLSETLRSLDRQTFTDYEIIVVDDGSSDGTDKILGKHATKNKRLRWCGQQNAGQASALNAAFKMSVGELIARIDADDLAEPCRLAEQVAFMEKNQNVVLSGSDIRIIDSSGWTLGIEKKDVSHLEIERNLLLGQGEAVVATVSMFRRSAAIRAGLYNESRSCVEDLDLSLRLAEIGELSNLNKVLGSYRKHSSAVSFGKRVAMLERCRAAVFEAQTRRGLPLHFAMEMPERELSAIECHREWASYALRQCYRGAAIKHALLAVLKARGGARSLGFLKYVLTECVTRSCAESACTSEAGRLAS